MNKYDFINRLQRYLTGKVSADKLQELTRYYNQYIDGEIRKGKSEEEVLASLGDPRLLAKSIISAEGHGMYEEEDVAGYGMYEEKLPDEGEKYAGFSKKLKTILIVIGIILVIVLLLSTVFRIIRFFLPVLIPLLIAWFLVQMWNNR
ncbi:MAG: DUF1700 domain-containing protein [Lachnospiraceae bacterium]|nr:DUF1700 domain-containing protein [Lachnospiraceae bacterium]